MNDFAPFILIYIPEHQFISTVFVSKMCVMVTFHFSFHFNVLFCAFPFFCRRRRGDILTCQLRVASCQLRVASCQLRVDICQLSVASCQLIFVSCELSVNICQLRVDICQLRVASCELRVASWSLFCWRSPARARLTDWYVFLFV